ncbi:glycoside hydrolase family 2 protein [Granulicella tundricola]|uniref:Glycoside hydrolase family 2 sugar binding protein n=1 Tax=Granulicella tundricola (strain ATCC BAA-1859 / DSM 23138 / MP5ACTX9) TaxID=1198114 RepID=E8X0M7_GRATM|nr:glycoside hydrolase family 2 TIM barrel-domain containing protein [Granulicella tundricola]ADW68978.1 glycoside hydrolase family 2 sugar binding protein [Granulicella tundricola MP5ACTX9]
MLVSTSGLTPRLTHGLLASALLLSTAAFGQVLRPAGSGEVDTTATQTATFTQGTTVLEGADRRPQTSLDGAWHSIADPYFTGLYNFHHEMKKDGWFKNEHWAGIGDNRLLEYDFAKSPTLNVPGDWNTQRDSLFLYEGAVWYQRDFTWHNTTGKRTFLHVGAANYRSWFWVNGQKVCQHEGGFTTFDCDVTAALKDGSNFIVAAVNNQRLPEGVPTLETDWWNYGGLTRSLALVEVPEAFITGYDLHLDRATRTHIEGWVQVANAHAGEEVGVSLPELHATTMAKVDADGHAAISFTPKNLKLWSPGKPVLYKVDLTAGNDAIHEEMGFKTIETRGTQILVNGDPIYLRGISIHAEAPYRTGRANTQKDMDTLLGWARELGCNYVRLAHYPHDEKMTRTADRLGILVWSEIPTYWAIQFDNPIVLAKAKQQLNEEISRDRNKVSIGLWSIANETPATEARTKFLTALAEETRRLDKERLVTAALLVRDGDKSKHEKVVDDKLGQALDVIGMNEYVGWYEGKPETADLMQWTVAYQKPVIVSEFGGEGPAGVHGTADQRWTEEYVANLYTHNLKMLAAIPQVRGMSPWLLMDFRSPSRQMPGMQDYFNRKGLISEKGQKKLAFGVLQNAYRSGYGNAGSK